jgi:hypothetical protein
MNMPLTPSSKALLQAIADMREYYKLNRNVGPILDDLLERVASLPKDDEQEAPNEDVYVPGEWECPKCHFGLSQRTLNVPSGNVTGRDDPGQECPNCACGLWRVTWKTRAMRASEMLQDLYRERAAELSSLPSSPSIEPREGVDIDQIIYALERAFRRLDHEAATLHEQGDYDAQFPAADAERMQEAIALLRTPQPALPQGGAVALPIDYDKDYDRYYIPLPGAVLVLVAIDVFIEARARSLAQGRESDAVTE